MKSKTRNSKGAKKSLNGVAHGLKESGSSGLIKTLKSLPPDQKQPRSNDSSHYDSTTVTDAEFNLARARDDALDIPPLEHSDHLTASSVTLNGNGSLIYPRLDKRPTPTTSMETEYIEALYSARPSQSPSTVVVNLDHSQNDAYIKHLNLDGTPPNSSLGSDDIDYEDIDSYGDQREDRQSEDFDGDLDVYDNDDFLSSQEAILMELRREQVEFEENVRQLQQQLQGSLPLLADTDGIVHNETYSGPTELTTNPAHDYNTSWRTPDYNAEQATISSISMDSSGLRYVCKLCADPKPTLCLERCGWIWRPLIIEAIATAAASIATLCALQDYPDVDEEGNRSLLQQSFRYADLLPKHRRPTVNQGSMQLHNRTSNGGALFGNSISAINASSVGDHPSLNQSASIRHLHRNALPPPPAIRYPLPPNSPYKFRRKPSEFLEPVGEFHEFQLAEGNSRQVLLHVWPPSSLDIPLLQKLEACCKDFQENDVVRGHSGDGFLNGWRPSWKQPHQTGILRFGHWRVRASTDQETHLYPPFQTPLTLAAGGGTILGPTLNVNGSTNNQHQPSHPSKDQSKNTQTIAPGSQPNSCKHNRACGHPSSEQYNDPHLESTTQGRLLRLIRAIQLVEEVIIARHLKYLFPTLYEKYHGLQFGTPRLFNAVATVALAMDVSPQLHRDKAHTKHGFCWIVACGDFVGGDLCIPELGKRVVMRPGTVVAIRSTVVAYYVERYAKNTSMYTMYAYTSDNNWPPAA